MNINGIPTNPGELKTRVALRKQSVTTGPGGFQAPAYTDLATVWSKWTNAHGNEVFASNIVESIAPAHVFIRYRADVDATCILLLNGKIYEITSIDDVYNRHEYLALTAVYVRSG